MANNSGANTPATLHFEHSAIKSSCLLTVRPVPSETPAHSTGVVEGVTDTLTACLHSALAGTTELLILCHLNNTLLVITLSVSNVKERDVHKGIARRRK